ncbi:MAG: phosphotransferase [Thermoactinospora sp.]|nr:phosphotransferase [Thermoactinospora sp.]
MSMAWVFAEYGLAEGTMSVAGRGAMGRIWRLDSGGSSYAMKEFFWAGLDEAAVREEAALRDRAVELGLRAPLNLPTTSGAYLAERDGTQVRLYSWADGVPGSPADAEEAGTILGTLHATALLTGRPVDPWYDRVAAAPGRWSEIPEAVPYEERLAELAALVRPADPGSARLCHLDMKQSNLMRAPDGGLVVLDWDNTGPGVPERELAGMLLRWHHHDGQVDGDGIKATVAAYRRACGLGPPSGLGAFSMEAAVLLNYLDAQARLAADEDADPEHRRFAVEAVTDVLAHLPAVAAFERVLDAAA